MPKRIPAETKRAVARGKARGVSQRKLARQYGVARGTVAAVPAEASSPPSSPSSLPELQTVFELLVRRQQFRNPRYQDFIPRPASQATTARPGSAEKIAVMISRVEAGEELWHPDDVTSFPELFGGLGLTRTPNVQNELLQRSDSLKPQRRETMDTLRAEAVRVAKAGFGHGTIIAALVVALFQRLLAILTKAPGAAIEDDDLGRLIEAKLGEFYAKPAAFEWKTIVQKLLKWFLEEILPIILKDLPDPTPQPGPTPA